MHAVGGLTVVVVVLLVAGVPAEGVHTTTRAWAADDEGHNSTVAVPLEQGSDGATTPQVVLSDRQILRQERQERRRNAQIRRSTSAQNRRVRGERRRQRLQQQNINRDNITTPLNPPSVDMQWLLANLSSLWDTVRSLQLEHQHHTTDLNLTSEGVTEQPGTTSRCSEHDYLHCDVIPSMCSVNEGDAPCSGRGECCCEGCVCDLHNQGRYCECGDQLCPRYDGLICGGRGNCFCGRCQCEGGYTGESCQCPDSTDGCINPLTGMLCSGNGVCQCDACRCHEDSGIRHYGTYCSESPYTANLCGELRPCVLCALGFQRPQCSQCGHVNVRFVDEIEIDELQPSRRLCLMVHSGCVIKYAFLHADVGHYDVTVPSGTDIIC